MKKCAVHTAFNLAQRLEINHSSAGYLSVTILSSHDLSRSTSATSTSLTLYSQCKLASMSVILLAICTSSALQSADNKRRFCSTHHYNAAHKHSNHSKGRFSYKKRTKKHVEMKIGQVWETYVHRLRGVVKYKTQELLRINKWQIGHSLSRMLPNFVNSQIEKRARASGLKQTLHSVVPVARAVVEHL